MIAFRDNLPLVQFRDGRLLTFEKRWLIYSLQRAAGGAGYANWWLADHVVESVTTYLESEFDDNIVSAERLEKAVRSVLQVIGYADVATKFQPSLPPAHLSLDDLARQAGDGYELAFFNLLRTQLRELIESRIEIVQLTELKPCVKRLRSAKHWSTDCMGLRNEIVGFVHLELDSLDRSENFSLQLL